MIGDADDWTYISYLRQAVIDYGGWNPAKIFPETFMGICGNIAAFVIYPIIGDYVKTMTVTYGTIISVFVVIYAFSFYTLIKNIFQMHKYEGCAVTFFFISSHFLMFKSQSFNNIYMLLSGSLNRCMNYLVPMLLNMILFMIIANEKWGNVKHRDKEFCGLIFLMLYLAIFSNMAVNIILIAPIIVLFFNKGYQYLKQRKEQKLTEFVNNIKEYIVVALLELICLISEFSGGRASSLNFDIRLNIQEVIEDWKTIVMLVEKKYFVTSILIVIFAFGIYFSRKNLSDKLDKIFLEISQVCLASLVICIVYMTALYIRIGQHKLSRVDNISVIFMFYGMSVALSCAYIFQRIKKISYAIPVMIYITFFSVINVSTIRGNYFEGGGNLYLGAHSGYYTADQCYEANTELIDQIIKADKDGLDEIVIKGPWILSQADWMGNRVSKTLYRHGIISREIDVIISYIK